MSRINNSVQIFSGVWNFAADGGAIGTINTGINIPANSFITEFGVTFPILLNDAGLGASISFDLLNTSGSVVYPAIILGFYFSNPNITLAPPVPYPQVFADLNINATGNAIKTLADTAIGFSIGNFPLLGGQIQFYAKATMISEF